MTDELEKEGTDITSSPLRWKSAQIGINVLFFVALKRSGRRWKHIQHWHKKRCVSKQLHSFGVKLAST